MILNEKTYQSWSQLNLTEQYFTLLEAWLIHGNDETLGEYYGEKNLLMGWSRIMCYSNRQVRRGQINYRLGQICQKGKFSYEY